MQVTLRENQTERLLLLSLWPTNLPIGQPIHFQLIPQKSSLDWIEAFQLDPITGLLWLDTTDGGKLDREKCAQLQFAIQAVGGE